MHRLRAKAGISARELARVAGLSETHVSQIETTLGAGVNAKTLAPLARALGTSIDWLVSGEGAEPSQEDVRAAVERAHRAA